MHTKLTLFVQTFSRFILFSHSGEIPVPDVALINGLGVSCSRQLPLEMAAVDRTEPSRNISGSLNALHRTLFTFFSLCPASRRTAFGVSVVVPFQEILRSTFASEMVSFGTKKTWLGYDKEEIIENYNCKIYGISNVQFSMLSRTDHFTPELEKRRKDQRDKGEAKLQKVKTWAGLSVSLCVCASVCVYLSLCVFVCLSMAVCLCLAVSTLCL